MRCKTVVVAAACLVGAGAMFFLGVMTERRWAARQLAVAVDSDIARRVAEGVARADVETVDVNALDFPEALRCLDPPPQDLAPAESESSAAAAAIQPGTQAAGAPTPAEPAAAIFLQVGAFGDKANADRFMTALAARGFEPNMQADAAASRYRIRIGPFASLDAARATTRRLEAQNLKYLVDR